MVTPLQPRVSMHAWALSAALETQNVNIRGISAGLSAWMLGEDFDNRHYAYEMGLEYDGVDYQRGDHVISGLLRELGRYGREDAARLLPRTVSADARDYLMYGRCMFELFEDAHSDTPGPRLGVLPGWLLKHRWGGTFQATPRAGKLEWRRLPTTALIELRLPGRLGKELYRTRKFLQVLDAHRAGDPAVWATAQSTGYDFNTHRNSLDEMAARATKSIRLGRTRALSGTRNEQLPHLPTASIPAHLANSGLVHNEGTEPHLQPSRGERPHVTEGTRHRFAYHRTRRTPYGRRQRRHRITGRHLQPSAS